jgi:hypothetical protein
MSKARNILRLKKRSRALPSSPWLGHEQEGRGRWKGKSKGRRRMAVRSGTARGEIVEPRKQHKQRREQKEGANRVSVEVDDTKE